jgi:hypothetical protein
MMKIIPIISLLFLILPPGASAAKKLAVLPEITNPAEFHMVEDRIYVAEEFNFFIYSQKDYKLIKKYGQEGEGPGEFMQVGGNKLMLTIEPEHLLVNSYGRLSYFTKEGVYLKEKKIKTVAKLLLPIGDRWAGLKYKYEDKVLYHYVNIYDSAFNLVKTIHKHKHGLQFRTENKFNPLTISPPNFKIYKNRIYMLDGACETLYVFNAKGEMLFSLTNKDELRQFTAEDKEQLLRDPWWKRLYRTRKHLFSFPSHFPPIDWFYIDRTRGTIYLRTYHEKDGGKKYLEFGPDGKFIKALQLPSCPGGQCLVAFFNGSFYRLQENEDEELWEVHVVGLEE